MTAFRMSIGVVCDMLEERWPSMDLVADMLVDQLSTRHHDRYLVHKIRPPMERRFSRSHARDGLGFTVDRLVSRFRDYPRFLRDYARGCDVFHVVDHSYAQLIHALPRDRTVVSCNDLDTFRSVLEPEQAPRSLPFRMMTRRILSGFRRAAHVACISETIREELLRHNLVPPERVSVVHLGVHPSCTPLPEERPDAEADRLLGPGGETIDVLHVGSTIERKRIDLLLRIFASIRTEWPSARLVRVGGPLEPRQRDLARDLGLSGSILELPFLDRATIGAVYRRAAVVLLPSEAEGFGLPLAEAMACGTPVVASDIPVLREVGSDAASYAAVGALHEWVHQVSRVLREKSENGSSWQARRAQLLKRAASFSWEEYARRMTLIYDSLARAGERRVTTVASP